MSDWREETYPILFESKDKESGWDSNRDEEFWKAVRAVKKECVERCEAENREIKYDFSTIHFPDFTYPEEHFNNERIFHTAALFWEAGEVYGFENANFRRAKFQDANFSWAEFQDANFSWAKFQDADFSWAKFQDADFSWAKFQDADFSGAEFQDANFSRAEFQDANFSRAEFQDADFSWAEFQDANFSYIDSESFLALHATFSKKLRFDYATIKKIVFTGRSHIQHLTSLHATFEEAYFNGATIHDGDRDAFRILKKSFDDQGDHIKANEFYSREMAAYEKELAKELWRTHFEDKIIFFIGKAISNFSQSWLQPLTWIICWSVFLYLFQSQNNGMLTNQISFNEFFQFINPFETSYTDGKQIIYGWWLLHKIGLSFLLYHFVVALRRQMKR